MVNEAARNVASNRLGIKRSLIGDGIMLDAEKAFAYSIACRLVAIDAILNRLLSRTNDPHDVLNEAELVLDRAHGDHLSKLDSNAKEGFLEVIRQSSKYIEMMREGIAKHNQ